MPVSPDVPVLMVPSGMGLRWEKARDGHLHMQHHREDSGKLNLNTPSVLLETYRRLEAGQAYHSGIGIMARKGKGIKVSLLFGLRSGRHPPEPMNYST